MKNQHQPLALSVLATFCATMTFSAGAQTTPADPAPAQKPVQQVVIEGRHDDNAVGTADAASQGVIRAELLKSRPALRPGENAEFAVWRADIFQPLAFDWRVSAVRRGDDGDTLPIETSAWAQGTERELEIAS